jgi:hypothetical protein
MAGAVRVWLKGVACCLAVLVFQCNASNSSDRQSLQDGDDVLLRSIQLWEELESVHRAAVDARLSAVLAKGSFDDSVSMGVRDRRSVRITCKYITVICDGRFSRDRSSHCQSSLVRIAWSAGCLVRTARVRLVIEWNQVLSIFNDAL